jgi:hypothetical protein
MIFRMTLDKIMLGRWERTCAIGNAIKIDWANTDHCGVCKYHRPTDPLVAKNDKPLDHQSLSYTEHTQKMPGTKEELK